MSSIQYLQSQLVKMMPDYYRGDNYNASLNVSNRAIWQSEDFLVGDIFKIGDWTIEIIKVNNFTLHVRAQDNQTGGKLVEAKRLSNHYLRNNISNFEYIHKVDRHDYRKAWMAEEDKKKEEKKKASAIKRKQAQLKKLQEELAALEN